MTNDTVPIGLDNLGRRPQTIPGLIFDYACRMRKSPRMVAKPGALKSRRSEWNRPKSATLRGLVVVLVGAGLTATFSGLNRPLWADEFLHFALAGQTWPEVWNYIVLTSPGTNHGQTWFYQVLSIFLLDLFGPSFLGLRLVSWGATFVFFVSTYYFLRLFSVPMGIQLFVVGLVLVNRYFSFEMGNGRPYLLLVTTTALATYALFSLLASGETRFKSKFFFGVVVFVGALNHPYFPIVLGALIVAFFFVKGFLHDDELVANFKFLRGHLVLTSVSGLLSILVGQLTWLRGSPDFTYFDPFASFKKYGLDVGVFEFVVLTALFVLATGFLAFSVRGPAKKSSIEPRLLVGWVLVLAGVGLSLFFTWLSIFRNYWILPRQWLPGAFLVLLGLALVLAVVASYLGEKKLRLVLATVTTVVWIVAIVMIAFGGLRELSATTENRAWWKSLSGASLETADKDGYGFWVVAGNLNMKCDDTVWPELALYYDPSVSRESTLEQLKGLASSCEDSD